MTGEPILLPADPAKVPALTVDPEKITAFGRDLTTASAQLDDLGGFASGSAKAKKWRGEDADAYHESVKGFGSDADGLSLGLRDVGKKVDAHAERMRTLLDEREELVERYVSAKRWASGLRERGETVTEETAESLRDDCKRCRERIERLDADVTDWAEDVADEEDRMVRVFRRTDELKETLDRFEGRTDPADAAIRSKPKDGTPEQNKEWWDSLSPQERTAIIAAYPGAIGNLQGIPAQARSDANEVSLGRDISSLEEKLESQGSLSEAEQRRLDNAKAAEKALSSTREREDPVTGDPLVSQLYIYDPDAFDGDGAAAVSAGDLDTADNLAVNVPGLTTDGSSITGNAENAADLYDATRAMHPDQTTATLAWINYDAPSTSLTDSAGVVSESKATEGGNRLADDLDGLRASRDDRANLTVIGHSYGSTTMGHALSDHDVDVDAAIAIGSPGMGGDVDNVDDLDVPDDMFFVGRNSDDPVANLGDKGHVHKGNTLDGAGMGRDPAEDKFGGRRFEAEDEGRDDVRMHTWDYLERDAAQQTKEEHSNSVDQHTGYYDPNSESLWNMSQIVTGNTGEEDYTGAGHVTDPWLGGWKDPEADAEVDHPSTSQEVP